MKKNELFENAMGLIDDEFLADAREVPRIQSRPIRRYRPLIAAACLLVMIALIPLSAWLANNQGHAPAETIKLREKDERIISVAPNPKPTALPAQKPLLFCEGSEDSAKTPSSMSELLAVTGLTVTCELVDVLPDTYLTYQELDSEELILLRMRTVKLLQGESITSEFYLALPVQYKTDFTKYSRFILKYIDQKAPDYFILYNQTKGHNEAFSLPMFTCHASAVNAFDSQNIFDLSLWTSTETWTQSTEYVRSFVANKEKSVIFIGCTLKEAEEKLCGTMAYSTFTLSDITGSAAEVLAYCQNSENGTYIPNLFPKQPMGYSPRFRRYLNGYPTNEVIDFSRKDTVKRSTFAFSEEDMTKLPDLASAVQAVSEAYHQGRLTPPHIASLEGKALDSYGIFGWYEKTENGVLGIIRVSWKYVEPDTDGTEKEFFDDRYFVIEYGNDNYQAIDRDELLTQIRDVGFSFIYTGDYNEEGKVYSVWCF